MKTIGILLSFSFLGFAFAAPSDVTNEIQKNPARVCQIFEGTLAAKENWRTQDIYEVYMAVLASSDLKKTFLKDYENFKKGKNTSSEGVRLLQVLKNRLSKTQFDELIGMLMQNANGVVSADFSGPNTNGFLKRDPRPNPVPVTPEPISPQN